MALDITAQDIIIDESAGLTRPPNGRFSGDGGRLPPHHKFPHSRHL